MKRLLVFMLILILGFCAYWYSLRLGLERALTAAQTDMAKSGVTLSMPDILYSGFPLSLNAILSEAQISGAQGSVRAEVFTLTGSPFNPTRWIFQSQGDMRIDWRQNPETRYLFDLSPSLVRGEFMATLSGQLKSARITGFKLTTTPVIGTAPPLRAVESAVLNLQANGGIMTFDLSVVDAFMDRSTARDFQRIFGPHIKALSVKGDLPGLSTLDEDAIEKWRQSGQVNITKSDLIWGDGQFKSEAALTLSPSGTSGIVTVKMRDASKLLDGLIASGKIDSQMALGARFALLAAPRDETGLISLELPIEHNNVKLFGQTVFKF